MTIQSAAPATSQSGAASSARRRVLAFGLSWRVLALVVAALMTAEMLIFLPSIARFRQNHLEQLIESGTLASLALDATPDNMVTDIGDNGPGLPQPVIAQLFRPFTTVGRAGGAGLGLAIARDLVRAHGGDITLADSGPSGATFRFTIPL